MKKIFKITVFISAMWYQLTMPTVLLWLNLKWYWMNTNGNHICAGIHKKERNIKIVSARVNMMQNWVNYRWVKFYYVLVIIRFIIQHQNIVFPALLLFFLCFCLCLRVDDKIEPGIFYVLLYLFCVNALTSESFFYYKFLN